MSFTLGMIKPDAIERGVEKDILRDIEGAGFSVVSIKKMRFSDELAKKFYAEHAGKSFFLDLIDYMTSGDVIVLKLEKDCPEAFADFRLLIGATDPAEAEEGTLRNQYAISKDKNSVHGSDSDNAATRELSLIFG